MCDIEDVQTGQGPLFLAAVQDAFSRRIIGWSMRDDLKAELVLDALGMAVAARRGRSAGVVCHFRSRQSLHQSALRRLGQADGH